MKPEASKTLKPGWRRVKFGDVVRQCKEKADPETSGLERYIAGDHMDTDDLRLRRWGEIGSGYLGPAFHMRFKPGQVLYGSRRTYLRKVAVADFDGICANTTFVLESKNPEELLPTFLPFLMQTEAFNEYSVKKSKGSVNPYINFSDLALFEFALPPLDEQARLMRLLDVWHQASDKSRQAITAAQTMRRAAFTQFFEYGTRGEGRVVTSIGPRPVTWTFAALGDRYDVQLGKMMSEEARSSLGQTPYLRNANVQWNKLELDDIAEMAFTPKEKEKFSLRYGDILACEGRHVGKSAMWAEEIPGACFQKALHRLRRRSNLDEPRYLLHCLQYYAWSGKFIAVTGETTIPHLSAERFRAMLFPFPPLDEQIDISVAIDEIDAGIEALEERQRQASRTLSQVLTEYLGKSNV